MAYTQQQLDDLEAAIAEGALEVQYEDRRVRYRSLEQMEAVRAKLRAALGHTSSGPKRILSSPSKFGHTSGGH